MENPTFGRYPPTSRDCISELRWSWMIIRVSGSKYMSYTCDWNRFYGRLKKNESKSTFFFIKMELRELLSSRAPSGYRIWTFAYDKNPDSDFRGLEVPYTSGFDFPANYGP